MSGYLYQPDQNGAGSADAGSTHARIPCGMTGGYYGYKRYGGSSLGVALGLVLIVLILLQPGD